MCPAENSLVSGTSSNMSSAKGCEQSTLTKQDLLSRLSDLQEKLKSTLANQLLTVRFSPAKHFEGVKKKNNDKFPTSQTGHEGPTMLKLNVTHWIVGMEGNRQRQKNAETVPVHYSV